MPVDLSLVNPPTVRTMGIVQLAASLAALISLPWQTRERRPIVTFFAALCGFFFFLATDASRSVWDTLPPLQFVQLPTRLLGLASLGAAGLAGAFVSAIIAPTLSIAPGRRSYGSSNAALEPHQRDSPRLPRSPAPRLTPRPVIGAIGVATLTLACILNGLPWFYALTCPTPVNPGAREIAAATELPLRTTAEGSLEFLPVWVGEIPDTTAFAEEYAGGRTPERLDTTNAPPNAQKERLFSIRFILQSVVVFLLIFALKALYLDRFDNPLRADRLALGQLGNAQHPTGIDFGTELRHLGYDLPRESVSSGGAVTVTQFWTALSDIGVPYGMEIRIADDDS